MSRLIILILFVVLLGGGAYYLSTLPKAQPTKTIEVDVARADNAK